MHLYSKLLKKELICALGCTEPIALALAAAKAREVLGSMPKKVTVKCSGNIIKNVKGVTVPNTNGMRGVEAAAAIGIAGGDSNAGLEALEKVTEKDIELAKKMLDDGMITVELKKGIENLDIEIMLEDEKDNTVEVEIKNKHTNIIKVKKNGEFLVSLDTNEIAQMEDFYNDMTLKSIFEYADTVDLSEIKDLMKMQIELNEEISKEGLKGKWGANIGKLLLLEGDGLRSKAKALAAAGSDARMSGCSMPVVINAGSGNQGITCSMPVLVYAREKNLSEDKLIRALLISNLTALHIKRYIGRLSAFCGVTSAGVAAAAGMAYLEKGDFKTIEDTVGNALMIVSGMVCDGAKASCAAKISASVDAGMTGLNMALAGNNFRAGDGLLKEDIEDTIRNIGSMAKDGMKETDIKILNLMIEK